MNYISFGSLLREARIRNGYEINTVSNDLRIRPDIIRAIEESDFSRMPPRGYAKNMIHAYARYVGLNPNEITRMYLDEQYASDVATSRVDFGNTISTRRSSAASTSQFSAVPGRTRSTGVSTSPLGRDTYTMDEENELRSARAREVNAHRESAAGRGRANTRSAQRSSVNRQYGNMYSQPQGFDLRSKLPFLAIILAILLVIFIVFNVVSCMNKQEEANTIPVTGLEEGAAEEEVKTEPAPTSMTLEFEVTSDAGAYIEVYVDGKPEVADDVAGGTVKSFTSSDTIKFVTTHPDNVVVRINGVEKPLEPNKNDIATINLTFTDVLSAWYAEHPDVPRPAGLSTSSSSTSSSSTSGSSSSTSGTSSSSKSASGTSVSNDD